ncbi:heterokaryon incompatibility protein-domain-containing protein [Daldinia vernicosa]|uniref:heterokaryon incompatibility protein-domain-containing protein n=1 Tax=Daldinia vernicosa TaxID=114800 RepID=UPI002007C38A|nr:heterokaryon incompatibility protein-domain-containing protein [Daldinia vernicosa]KAI0853597.1 heterokaryon incompatibility protein-domain-containing protein [Daldinia vernicosa]
MSYITELCPACRSVLCPENEIRDEGYATVELKPEAFQSAVKQGCAICSIIWNKTEQQAKTWFQTLPEACIKLEFDYSSIEPKGTSLFVYYTYPTSDSFDILSFHIIPADGVPRIEPSTSSTSSLTAAYNWFQGCCSTHTNCNSKIFAKAGWYPTRLVDIGHKESSHWRLLVVSEDGISPQSAPYMTLSYRWAPNPKPILLASNIDEFRHGKPIKDFPQTFRDFIVVARRFSIRYIWIDALCIIQDSRGDWEIEAPTMRFVYANSICNVAASVSNSPNEGLFRSRDIDKLNVRIVPCSLYSGKEEPSYIYEEFWDETIPEAPLHKRGWVLQECILASRVLYFGKNQIFWECLTRRKCELLPNGLPLEEPSRRDLIDLLHQADTSNSRKMSDDLSELWIRYVNEYSRCTLTNPSDKLAAIAGIAQLFQDFTGDEYIAGLWKSRLVEMLNWRVLMPRELKSLDYRAPSWSWASTEGDLNFEVHYDVELPELVDVPLPGPFDVRLPELLDVCVRARGPHNMTGILEGSITLRANILVVTSGGNQGHDRYSVFDDTGRSICLEFYPDRLNIDLPEGDKLTLMHLRPKWGWFLHYLVLVEVFVPAGSEVQYRRVGYAFPENEKYEEECKDEYDYFMSRSSVENITIV